MFASYATAKAQTLDLENLLGDLDEAVGQYLPRRAISALPTPVSKRSRIVSSSHIPMMDALKPLNYDESFHEDARRWFATTTSEL
jgi:hypothetical protein